MQSEWALRAAERIADQERRRTDCGIACDPSFLNTIRAEIIDDEHARGCPYKLHAEPVLDERNSQEPDDLRQKETPREDS